MINVLPPDVKQGYGYARRNVVLRRWVIIIVVTIIGLGAITTYGLLAFQQSGRENDRQIAKSQASLQKEHFGAAQQQVKDMNSSFKLVLKVLSQEVLFSQLIKQVAVAVPAGANLTGLTINQSQAAIDISANAVDYNTATQVQVNLADPKNKIFSKADIVNINCGTTGNGNSAYPCTVTMRALFAANNPFLFINSKGAKP
jgi:hypothetical protein